jgi:Lrp/AsnC family leucine-responsive transcriptional regulator
MENHHRKNDFRLHWWPTKPLSRFLTLWNIMDETDLKMIELLWKNPRSSYRELADELGISTPAVHRRLQACREKDIILGPYARLSADFLRAVYLMVYGKSSAKSFEEIHEALKKGDQTDTFTLMGGNVVLLWGLLRDVNELDGYVDFIRKAAQIEEPFLGIAPKDPLMCEPKSEFDIKLTKVDFKIMGALRKDGMMTVSDISKEINVSLKTVRNHLKRLIDEKVITFELIANQAHSGNFVPFIEVTLENGAEMKEVLARLRNNFFPPLIFTYTFSNHPKFFITQGWLKNMAQLSELVSQLNKVEGIDSIVTNTYIASRSLPTWLAKMLDDPMRAMEQLRERKLI